MYLNLPKNKIIMPTLDVKPKWYYPYSRHIAWLQMKWSNDFSSVNRADGYWGKTCKLKKKNIIRKSVFGQRKPTSNFFIQILSLGSFYERKNPSDVGSSNLLQKPARLSVVEVLLYVTYYRVFLLNFYRKNFLILRLVTLLPLSQI